MTSNDADPLCWQVGQVTVTRVAESLTPVPASYLITHLTAEQIDAERPWIDPYIDHADNMLLSVHSFVVESGGTTIVVDTCVGVHEGRRLDGDPAFLDRVGAVVAGGLAGVDVVVCTHLHFDHVGWNTVQGEDGSWRPAFPNARYLITADELDGFDDEDGVAPTSLTPLVAAGVLDRVATDHAITDDVRLLSTPGHTTGHVSVLIESAGASALITGDAVHSPIQFVHPELAATRVDHDSDRSTKTRHDLVARLTGTDTLVLGTHFAPPTAGHLRQRFDGDATTVWFDG